MSLFLLSLGRGLKPVSNKPPQLGCAPFVVSAMREEGALRTANQRLFSYSGKLLLILSYRLFCYIPRNLSLSLPLSLSLSICLLPPPPPLCLCPHPTPSVFACLSASPLLPPPPRLPVSLFLCLPACLPATPPPPFHPDASCDPISTK